MQPDQLPAPCYHIEWDDLGFGRVADVASEISVPGWSERGIRDAIATERARADALEAALRELVRLCNQQQKASYGRTIDPLPPKLQEWMAAWTIARSLIEPTKGST